MLIGVYGVCDIGLNNQPLIMPGALQDKLIVHMPDEDSTDGYLRPLQNQRLKSNIRDMRVLDRLARILAVSAMAADIPALRETTVPGCSC